MIKRNIEKLRPRATGLLLTAADFTLQLVATGILLALAAILVFVLKPFDWLPLANETDTLLGALLAAQAAIAALTIAVTLFMMQGINNRQDVDDRIYREYVTRSWVKELLRNSLLAVGVTGDGPFRPEARQRSRRSNLRCAGLTQPGLPRDRGVRF